MNRFAHLIKPHMPVYAKPIQSDQGIEGIAVQIGRVDSMEGDFIKLTRGESPDGQHQHLPLEWVERVEEDGVYLSRDADSVKRGVQSHQPEAL